MNATSPSSRLLMPLLLLLLGGAIVATIWQQKSISLLRSENQALRHQTAEMERLRHEAAQVTEQQASAGELEKLRKDNAELNRLRNEISQLRAQGAQLEQLRADNQRLQTASQQLLQQKQAAETQLAQTSADQAAAMAAAKAQAESVRCLNQLKQIGLAGRVWAADNGDSLPPELASLSQQLADPRVLICPSDVAKTPAANWTQIQPANISYKVISPGVTTAEVEKVFVQCPLHGHTCLIDGSVHAAQAGR